MARKLEDFEPRVAELIQLGLQSQHANDPNLFHTFRTGSLSCLRQLYGQDHPYYTDFNDRVVTPFRQQDSLTGVGILQAVKKELDGGWFVSARGLISAEVFSDYLEMARYLLNEGYKDAAAVLAGSTLESHLRQLCHKAGIATESIKEGKPQPKKADLLNSELAAADTYGKLDQKGVTAWLDLRNKAAHGRYDEYSIEQVRLMVDSVTDFMARVHL